MTDPPASDSPTQGGSDAILTEPASEGPILTEAEVLDLQEEETRLYAARARRAPARRVVPPRPRLPRPVRAPPVRSLP
jgi:hypothetical protein